jgi:hypothetical protein
MRSSTLRVLGKGKSPLPQRPIPNNNSNNKTKTAEINIAAGTHTGGTSIALRTHRECNGDVSPTTNVGV